MSDEYNELTNGEKRRQARRDIERGIVANEPDKIQLNDIMLACLVVIAAIISFTDFSFSLGDIRNLTALTLFLYIITMFVYRNRYDKGKARGKTDKEYQASLAAYREKRDGIYERNLAGRVPEFCTYYKKKELKEYRESLLCDIEMDYATYKDKYLMMSNKQILKEPISGEAKKIIMRCNAAKSIRLYPGMILNENGEYDRDKLIGRSGRERERADKKKQAITRAVYVLFGAVVAFDMFLNFSWLTVAQWIVRMLPVVLAIITGDDGGFCNITVTETNFKHGQVNVINLFNEYVLPQEGAEKTVSKNV